MAYQNGHNKRPGSPIVPIVFIAIMALSMLGSIGGAALSVIIPIIIGALFVGVFVFVLISVIKKQNSSRDDMYGTQSDRVYPRTGSQQVPYRTSAPPAAVPQRATRQQIWHAADHDESSVDMQDVIDSYNDDKAEHTTFRMRPMTEEDKKRKRDELRSLLESGIMTEDEYHSKLREYRL